MKEPKIRLKGFCGEWETHSLKESDFIIVAGGDIDKNLIKLQGKYPVIANALSNDGIVGYYDSYFRVKAPAVSVTGRGEIGHAQARKTSFTPVVRLLSIQSKHDVDFLANAINCHKVVQESTGVPQLTTEKLSQYEIAFPTELEEEIAIGKYIVSIDSLIQSTTKKIESLKQVKAASLQSMFPQEGETTPRVRFKGFEGEWETVYLNSLCRNAASQLTESTLGENKGCYPVFGASGYLQNIEEYAFDVPYIGIIKDGSGVGRSQLYPACSSILGTMQYIIPNSGIDASYLACVFEGIDLTKFITGSTIPHIYFRDYCTLQLMMPSEEEQKKIGKYFTNLDSQITLQTQRLEKLKQIKSACLDNMFV